MGKDIKVLAIDFGASSGRAMLCHFNGESITLEEIHRFSNDPVLVNGSLFWDVLRLFHEIKQGLLKAINAGHKDISAIGIDTWGVDYALFNKSGSMIGNPYNYRDERTNGMIERAMEIAGREFIFKKTGIQFMFFNTLFQLLSMVEKKDSSLYGADKLLFMPDIFNYFLTGEMKNEYTIASTSQLLNAHEKKWDYELMDKLGIPKSIFGEIVMPGTVIGELQDYLCEELGCPKIPVVAIGSHDTASAVASVPVVDEDDYVYISCGTWSLLGVEADEPIINEKSEELNYTNEGGVEGKIRFLKNIMGLWVTQECRRQWQREGNSYSFDELENSAWVAAPFVSFIDVDDMSFASPGNMPKRIREFCSRTGQPVPEDIGAVIRCANQSLAFKYRKTIESLEAVLGKGLNVIHMVGGGIKDEMVSQFTANATGRTVIAGPIEATSAGNAIMQLKALGEISSLTQARQVIKNSFPVKVYTPTDEDKWNLAYQDYLKYVK